MKNKELTLHSHQKWRQRLLTVLFTIFHPKGLCATSALTIKPFLHFPLIPVQEASLFSHFPQNKIQIPLPGIQSVFQFKFNLPLQLYFPKVFSFMNSLLGPNRSTHDGKGRHIPASQPFVMPPASLLTLSTWLNPSHLQGLAPGPGPHPQLPQKILSQLCNCIIHLRLTISTLISIFISLISMP